MAEAEKSSSAAAPVRERQPSVAVPIEQHVTQLQQMRLGGFKLLETSIDGSEIFSPERKARKSIFLTDESRKQDRKQLRDRLQLWKDMLSKEGTSVTELAKEVDEKYQATEKLYKDNLAAVVSEVRELESTYKGVDLFFKNAETSGLKIRNIVFMNAGLDQLNPADPTNAETIEHIKNEVHKVYNRFDLRESYSLMVIPGYLGSKRTVDTWAKIAHDHKLMLVTDYQNLDSLKETLKEFQREKLAADEGRYANVLMACNPIVGRGKYDELEEYDDLYVNPSSAIAGKMYMNLISQVSAGYQYGSLEDVDGARFDLLKTEVGELENQGLIPLTKEFGKVIAFSGKTLYNGSNIGLKTYSVVRVFDWIMKVLMCFLNKRAMENWSGKVEKEITEEIIQFLDQIKGPGKIIERFEAPQFRQDPIQKDRIFVDINITPFFPAKTFVIGLHGERGRDESTGRRGDFKGDVSQR
ncbi:hypothetical protein BN8_04166 [Fibrisoma limi BUZ 3]|uniref:Type VI secretion system contractile sheath protein TssC n=1 Tax=Fibrisoma limi BUZ 3 TaxID=1185876 RepID=I2GM18_9BACT|nr:hypothetical protein [Fibrisoma limi]CCH54944.1 hypothetical protein BN8_04166 [Fibrisoma limi BUZ 3]